MSVKIGSAPQWYNQKFLITILFLLDRCTVVHVHVHYFMVPKGLGKLQKSYLEATQNNERKTSIASALMLISFLCSVFYFLFF